MFEVPAIDRAADIIGNSPDLALQSGALTVLVREGLDLSPAQVSALPRLMLRLLDVEDLDDAG